MFDNWMKFHLKVQSTQSNNDKIIEKYFVFGIGVSIVATITFVINLYFFEFHFFVNSFMLSSLIHLIQLQLLEFLVFVLKIQGRLETLSRAKLCVNNKGIFLSKTAFIKLFEINKDAISCFKIPLSFCLVQVYSSVLINSYWFFASLLESRLAMTFEALSLIIPSFLFLILLLQADQKCRQALLKVHSKATTTLQIFEQTEEFLIVQHRCKFSTNILGLFGTSSASVCEVSVDFVLCLIDLFNYFFRFYSKHLDLWSF